LALLDFVDRFAPVFFAAVVFLGAHPAPHRVVRFAVGIFFNSY
jgi:hypothetical protein